MIDDCAILCVRLPFRIASAREVAAGVSVISNLHPRQATTFVMTGLNWDLKRVSAFQTLAARPDQLLIHSKHVRLAA